MNAFKSKAIKMITDEQLFCNNSTSLRYFNVNINRLCRLMILYIYTFCCHKYAPLKLIGWKMFSTSSVKRVFISTDLILTLVYCPDATVWMEYWCCNVKGKGHPTMKTINNETRIQFLMRIWPFL